MGALQGLNGARLCLEDPALVWPLAVQKLDSDLGPVLENCVHWEMINKTGQVTEAPLERTLLQGLDPGGSLPSASLSPSCSYRIVLDTWWLSSPYRLQAVDHQASKF